MHIALVHRDLHALTRGGIGTLYRALAARMAAAGHRITLIAQDAPAPLRLSGVAVVLLPRTEDLTAHRDAVAAALDQLAPDVVESSSWEAETLHYARRPAAGRAPVVVRGDLSAATMDAWPHLIAAERELLQRTEAVLAVSAFAAADLATAYGIARPIVVPNGVDRNRFRPGIPAPPARGDQITLGAGGTVCERHPLTAGALPPPWTTPGAGRRSVVWVGKTTPMKGWDRLERLAAALGDLAHLTVLVGHAPALSPVTLTGTEPHVTILQDVGEDDLPGFYRAADFILSTSRWEGFGLAIAEAIACGTPALVPADLGTAPELLAAGGGRSYRTLGQLRAILTAPPPAATLPAALDWDHTTATTLAIYQELNHHAPAAGTEHR